METLHRVAIQIHTQSLTIHWAKEVSEARVGSQVDRELKLQDIDLTTDMGEARITELDPHLHSTNSIHQIMEGLATSKKRMTRNCSKQFWSR